MEKLEALGRLAGGVAHDLNNALTAILGHASLLKSAVTDHPDQLESVGEIQRAAERAAKLARDLLAFSRRQMLRPRRIDPAEVVHRVRGVLGETLRDDIELIVDLPQTPLTVHVDPEKLEQALMNLALNADDAMPDGGRLSLALTHSGHEAEWTARFPFPIRPGRYVILTVADTGPGIPEELRTKVFEPFFSTKTKRMGLGLPTVYGFAKQSGGYVWLEDGEGHGTTIHLVLPLAPAEAAEPSNSQPHPGPGP